MQVWEYRVVNDEESQSPDQGTAAGPSGELVIYDCTAWSGESRRLFGSLLNMQGVANAWQGTEVTVSDTDTEIVDDLVDQVMSTARSAINHELPTIVYEMADWPDALQNEFAAQLTISEVAYEWNVDGDIVVNEADEDTVEEVIDMLPPVDSFDSVDGLEAQGILNEVFMTCDRRASKPTDGSAMERLRSTLAELDSMSPPFGFDDREWATLVASVRDVCAPETELSDKSLAKAAKATRDRVRSYV